MKQNELTKSIEIATRKAAEELFSQTGESFYYFSLITTGEALSPFISAWSNEQLSLLSMDQQSLLKWSYADSPYCAYGLSHFEPVQDLIEARPHVFDLPQQAAEKEYEFRLDAMESALRRLDEDGLFGTGVERKKILVNAEVMPPDFTNKERAKRLNSGPELEAWLLEAAEA